VCEELLRDGEVSFPAVRVVHSSTLLVQFHSVIFLNCGAVDSLHELLMLWDPSVRGYIIDAHRPVYHKNIKGSALRVLDSGVPMHLSDVPSDNDSELGLGDVDVHELGSSDDDDDRSSGVYSKSTDLDNDDDDDDGSSVEEAGARRKRLRRGGESPRGKRRRDVLAADAGESRGGALRRRAKRWQQYYSSHFFAAPSAYCMYRLARELGRERNDLLWLALVAVTDAYLQEAFGDEDYEVRVTRARVCID
jgi:cell division control protein 45